MSEVAKFHDWVFTTGVVQMSGAVFKPFWKYVPQSEKRFGKRLMKLMWPNTTPAQFCEMKAKIAGCTAEEFAAELNAANEAVANGDFRTVIGECKKCHDFLFEDEIHSCGEAV